MILRSPSTFIHCHPYNWVVVHRISLHGVVAPRAVEIRLQFVVPEFRKVVQLGPAQRYRPIRLRAEVHSIPCMPRFVVGAKSLRAFAQAPCWTTQLAVAITTVCTNFRAA